MVCAVTICNTPCSHTSGVVVERRPRELRGAGLDPHKSHRVVTISKTP